MKKTALEYKTIILSDIHLGMRDRKAKEVSHFLKYTHCETPDGELQLIDYPTFLKELNQASLTFS